MLNRPLPLAVALTLVLGFAAPLSACSQPTNLDQVDSMESDAGTLDVENVAGGLEHPWGMVFLPDGRALVTERAGRLRVLGTDGGLSGSVEGTPEVYAQGQGGLLDVALDPDFATNQYVYLSYAAPGPGGQAATALGRGKWTGEAITDFEPIYLQEPWITGPNHFGGRIVFDGAGHLFLTQGERFQFEPAQDLSVLLGKVVRLNHDGSVPQDNPFVGQENARPEIWTYGNRNIEAGAIDPATGALWILEMGPLGGDELNRLEPGKNYGWPVVSWGKHYDGKEIPDPPTRPEFADAAYHWTPVISPSGMVFYTGDVFDEWKGSALVGGLSSQALIRIAINGTGATEAERLPMGARIREVEQGPDGFIYVLTDKSDGNIWRIRPMK